MTPLAHAKIIDVWFLFLAATSIETGLREWLCVADFRHKFEEQGELLDGKPYEEADENQRDALDLCLVRTLSFLTSLRVYAARKGTRHTANLRLPYPEVEGRLTGFGEWLFRVAPRFVRLTIFSSFEVARRLTRFYKKHKWLLSVAAAVAAVLNVAKALNWGLDKVAHHTIWIVSGIIVAVILAFQKLLDSWGSAD